MITEDSIIKAHILTCIMEAGHAGWIDENGIANIWLIANGNTQMIVSAPMSQLEDAFISWCNNDDNSDYRIIPF